MIEPDGIPEFERDARESLQRRERERVLTGGWTAGWQPYMLIDPDKAERPAPPRVCGFLYDSRRHALSGEPESAKSMLALIVGLEYLRATPDKDVAVIDFEGSREMVSNMLAELGATFDEVQRISYFQPSGPPTDQDVYTIAEELNVGLVIIDSAIGAYDVSRLKDDGGRTDTEKMGRLWVRPFFEYDVATLLLDHVTKDAKTRGRWTIGSERKLGKTDISLGVDTITPISRGTTGLYKLVSGKDRGGYLKRGTTVAELHLASDPDTHKITWEFRKPAASAEAGWQPTVLMRRVSAYVITNPGASRTKIVEAVKGHSTEHKRMALDLLLEAGYITETDGPRRARLCTSLKPYVEMTPPPRLDPASTPPGGVGHDPASPPDPYKGAGRQAGLPSNHGEDDPAASSNGHINLTPDDREPLFEDGHIDPDELERLAAIAREAGA